MHWIISDQRGVADRNGVNEWRVSALDLELSSASGHFSLDNSAGHYYIYYLIITIETVGIYGDRIPCTFMDSY